MYRVTFFSGSKVDVDNTLGEQLKFAMAKFEATRKPKSLTYDERGLYAFFHLGRIESIASILEVPVEVGRKQSKFQDRINKYREQLEQVKPDWTTPPPPPNHKG